MTTYGIFYIAASTAIICASLTLVEVVGRFIYKHIKPVRHFMDRLFDSLPNW